MRCERGQWTRACGRRSQRRMRGEVMRRRAALRCLCARRSGPTSSCCLHRSARSVRARTYAAVGQTFQAVVCVANAGGAPLKGVRIVLEMHSEATDKFVATSRELANVDLPELAPQAQHCLMATHTLEAMAPHALVCRIRTDRGADKPWLAKYVAVLTQAIPLSRCAATFCDQLGCAAERGARARAAPRCGCARAHRRARAGAQCIGAPPVH